MNMSAVNPPLLIGALFSSPKLKRLQTYLDLNQERAIAKQ
jgi:hypothetical protein